MTILKEVLNAVLTENQRAAGIYLKEDEDFLYIYDKKGMRRGIFSAVTVTFDTIRVAADIIMKEED